jgi:hypothetical protein
VRKKIAIITLHSLTNPGSALQAFALQKYLSDCGCDAILFDYRPYYIFTGKKKIKTVVGKLVNMKSAFSRYRRFREFREEYMQLSSKTYYSYSALKRNPPTADLYITGSDQLWNYWYDCGRDDAYYLCFVKHGIKVAYAVSLGSDTVTEGALAHICERIRDFRFVTVREETSKRILSAAGIRDVEVLCDPTMLLDRSVYSQIERKPIDIPDRYLLVYLVSKHQQLNALIEKVAAKYNLKVIQIGSFVRHCNCDIVLKDIGPREFLALIANAQYVIASSFHATVFSLIYERNFSIIPPSGNAARIEQLLDMLGLKNRIVRTVEDFADDQIDYNIVRTKIMEFAIKSKSYLSGVLEAISC